jgi:hypothetical protein
MKLASIAAHVSLIASMAFNLPARAQDFSAPAPAGHTPGAGVALERSLPPSRAESGIEFLSVRWSAMTEFATHAVAADAWWQSVVFAAGVSSSGDAEVGWNAAAMLVGLDAPAAGIALRALVREERDPASVRALGLEIGGGFRSAITPNLTMWASAPSALRSGEPPPLDRGIEVGMRWCGRGFAAWGAWSAPARDVNAGERSIGIASGPGRFETWMEARENPLRGSLGMRASRGALEVAAEVGEHPVLGENVRVSLRVRGVRRP